jgi:hypothetical protein
VSASSIIEERYSESDLGEDLGHSYKWFVETADQVESGWRFFCRKRHWDPVKAAKGVTPGEEMKMEIAARRGRVAC